MHKVSFDFIQTCIIRVIEFLHITMPTLNPVGDTTGYTSLIVQPLVYLISHCSASEQAVRPEDTLHHDRRVPGALRHPTGGLGGQAGPGERYAHNIFKNEVKTLLLLLAYYHVPIRASHQKYLRFIWKGKVYQFLVLCFGLKTVSFSFS